MNASFRPYWLQYLCHPKNTNCSHENRNADCISASASAVASLELKLECFFQIINLLNVETVSQTITDEQEYLGSFFKFFAGVDGAFEVGAGNNWAMIGEQDGAVIGREVFDYSTERLIDRRGDERQPTIVETEPVEKTLIVAAAGQRDRSSSSCSAGCWFWPGWWRCRRRCTAPAERRPGCPSRSCR